MRLNSWRYFFYVLQIECSVSFSEGGQTQLDTHEICTVQERERERSASILGWSWSALMGQSKPSGPQVEKEAPVGPRVAEGDDGCCW
jgi:hypothetical protein